MGKRNSGKAQHSGGKRRATKNQQKADEERVDEVGERLSESRAPVERPADKAEVGLPESRVPLEKAYSILSTMISSSQRKMVCKKMARKKFGNMSVKLTKN